MDKSDCRKVVVDLTMMPFSLENGVMVSSRGYVIMSHEQYDKLLEENKMKLHEDQYMYNTILNVMEENGINRTNTGFAENIYDEVRKISKDKCWNISMIEHVIAKYNIK